MVVFLSLFTLLVLLMIFPRPYSDDGFTEKGILEQQTFAQDAAENNANDVTVLSMQLNSTLVVVAISKPSYSIRSFRTSKQITFLVGHAADCLAAERLCIDIDTKYRSEVDGSPIPAAMLAMKISNIAHQNSLYPSSSRPMGVNEVIYDLSASKEFHLRSYLVDVFGGFSRCHAVSVGKKSDRINSWFETRGAYLVSNIISGASSSQHEQKTDYSNDSTNNSTPDFGAFENENKDIINCFEICWSCLKENFGLATLSNASEYTVQLLVVNSNKVSESEAVSSKGFLSSSSHIFGPYVVNPSVFNLSLDSICLLDTPHETPISDERKGAEYDSFSKEKISTQKESDRLYQWWASLQSRLRTGFSHPSEINEIDKVDKVKPPSLFRPHSLLTVKKKTNSWIKYG